MTRSALRRFSSRAQEAKKFIASKGPQAYYDTIKCDVTNLSLEKAVEELLHGTGFVLYDKLYSELMMSEVKSVIAREVASQEPDVVDAKHVNAEVGHDRIYANSTKGEKQGKRVWNLLNKSEAFQEMVQHETVMQICEQILGYDFCLGSFAANCMQPGAQGQNPHIDYPYWDYNDSRAWVHKPKYGAAHPFHMNMQTLIMLDDFTVQNGATAVIPFSQLEVAWPNQATFMGQKIQITGTQGSTLIFPGLIHHAAMSNRSTADRVSVLGQYLPKYVRPMEDMDRSIDKKVRERATPRMKQLLGMNQMYPKIFEGAAKTRWEE